MSVGLLLAACKYRGGKEVIDHGKEHKADRQEGCFFSRQGAREFQEH